MSAQPLNKHRSVKSSRITWFTYFLSLINTFLSIYFVDLNLNERSNLKYTPLTPAIWLRFISELRVAIFLSHASLKGFLCFII